MPPIKILGKSLSDQSLNALKSLAGEAGCNLGAIEVIDSVGEPGPDCGDEVILVLASAEACSNPALEGELAKVPNGGRRAIVVWPKDDAVSQLPEGAQKFAYSILPWSADKLAKVLVDDDFTCFESSTGVPLPKVEMERNLCVDEPKKPK